MKSDTVHDRDLEKILKHCCSIPFFRDNPYYIRLWERYYFLCDKNPSILFFMKHKRISKNYHFLYIELSRHFEQKGLKDVSAWILQRAIEAGVYRGEVLVSELVRIGRPPGALTMDEIAKELNPQDFVLWGKKWCSKESSTMCERKSLEDSKHKCTTNALKEIGAGESLSSTASEGISSVQNAHICTKAYINTPCKLCLDGDNCSYFKMQGISIASKKPCEDHSVSESSAARIRRENTKYRQEKIHIGGVFTMENRGFYVKRRISQRQLLVIEMPGSPSEYQTAELMHYTIQNEESGMNRALFDKHIPDRIVNQGQVLLYKYYELGLLSSAVCLMPELNTFFFLKALEIAIYYAKKGVFFADLSMDDFFIDDDMTLVLCTFSQNEKGCVWKYRVFSELAIEHANTYMSMETDTAFRELSAKIRIMDIEDLLLRLKIAIF